MCGSGCADPRTQIWTGRCIWQICTDGADETRAPSTTWLGVERPRLDYDHVRDRGLARRGEEEALQWIADSFPKNPNGPTKRWALNIGALGL